MTGQPTGSFSHFLGWGLNHPWTTLASVGALTVFAAILGPRLGSEFVPRLNEGSVVVNTIRLASASLEESLRYGNRIEGYLKKHFPDEIQDIWTRTGTAEVATDPMGMELSDIFITLKPREEWKRAKTQAELVAAMASATKVLPGMRAVYTQPIEMRINEMVAGIRADLGIKLYGDNLETLKAKAEDIEKVVKTIHGAADTTVEQVTGLPVLRINVDNEALSRYGVPAQAVTDAIRSVGGIDVGEIIEPGRRFPLVIRLPMSYREDPNALESISITTASGQRLPLTRLASLEATSGPSTIQRDWGERRIIVQTNVRGRDIASFVRETQERIRGEVKLPTGYTIEWGGQLRALGASSTAALHRRSTRSRAHPKLALRHLPFDE